jgi:hypothetical protein
VTSLPDAQPSPQPTATADAAFPVELVHWPRERARRDALAKAGVPRLLLVAPGERPPIPLAVGEDWIRLPADERDTWARARNLARRAAADAAEVPRVDPDTGWLVRGGRTVALSEGESAVLRALLDPPGRVVPRGELEAVVWPQGAPSSRSLDDVVYRLRRRVAEVGVVVSSSRTRGFLVEPGPPPAGAPR